MKILESYVQHRDDGKSYGAGEDSIDLADTWMGEDATVGEIYRASLKEHGRCIGKVYIDRRENGDPEGTYPRTIAIGWVFQKRMKYEDCNETFLMETWVTLLDKDETHREIEYHANGNWYRYSD